MQKYDFKGTFGFDSCHYGRCFLYFWKMMDRIKIGVESSISPRVIDASLKELGLNHTFDIHRLVGKDMDDALRQNTTDINLNFLNDIPLTRSEDICIAALSKRITTALTLNIHPDAYVGNESFRMAKESLLLLPESTYLHQFREYRPDLVLFLDSDNSEVLDLKKASFLSVFLDDSKDHLPERAENQVNYHLVNVHPLEITPAVGNGILGYSCLTNNTGLRKILATLHSTETSTYSNQERLLLKKIAPKGNESLAAHCFQDAAGNYQMTAAYQREDGEMRRARRSYNTHSGLADDLYKELKN